MTYHKIFSVQFKMVLLHTRFNFNGLKIFDMTNIFYGIGVTIIVAIVGIVVGGTVEDAAWIAGG